MPQVNWWTRRASSRKADLDDNTKDTMREIFSYDEKNSWLVTFFAAMNEKEFDYHGDKDCNRPPY